MEIKENTPIVVYDNQCYLCVKFARFIDFFARGKMTMIGHYSDFGIKIKNEILDESALDMFWFIDKKRAYGGRAALFPLVKSIFSKKTKNTSTMNIDKNCQQDCKTVKAVFLRSSSLLTNSRKINL
jgi:predicted DCC family thiol-disulfide oxidoreductase YuxK